MTENPRTENPGTEHPSDEFDAVPESSERQGVHRERFIPARSSGLALKITVGILALLIVLGAAFILPRLGIAGASIAGTGVAGPRIAGASIAGPGPAGTSSPSGIEPRAGARGPAPGEGSTEPRSRIAVEPAG